jgi:hypothetical protein
VAVLNFTAAGTWTSSLGTGRIARWGDSLVNYRRVDSPAANSTRFEDTGAAAPFSTITVTGTGSATGALYGRPAEGNESNDLVMWRETGHIVAIDTSGAVTVISARLGSAGNVLAVTGRANFDLAYATEFGISATQVLGEHYDAFSGGGGFTGSTVATVTSPATQLTGRPWVDLDDDCICVGVLTSTTRAVRKYDTSGATVWTATLPNATTDGVIGVESIVEHPSLGLIAYTDDFDEPGGTRVNNNWWLIDKTTGTFELLDVTIDGVPFATWADTGINEIASPSGGGQICAVGGRIFFNGNGDGTVYGSTPTRLWNVGSVRW